MEVCYLCIGGVVALFVIILIWVFRKTIHPKKKFGLETSPVTGITRPINFLFDIVRGTTGVAIVKIQAKEFITEAKSIAEMTDTELFGPQDNFVEAVTLFVEDPDQSIMSASGILLFNGLVRRLLQTRRFCIEYIQKNRDVVLSSKLEKPIIISGLPRTGSTMLYNLLSCDPVARTPRFFEISQMANPTPPVTSLEARNNDPRIQQVMDRFEETEKLYPGMWTESGKAHRSHPNEIEEDLLVMFHSFVMQLHVPLSDTKYRVWYEDENNKKFAYQYHRLFFQMLNQSWTPESHWVLKAPVHSTYLDSLLEQYPDARIVITHRDPATVVPSWSSLLESYINWSYIPYACDRVKFGRYIADSLALCAERLLVWRKKVDPKQVFDVSYPKFVTNPILMVENLYAHFDLPVTDEFRENMADWIKHNRKGKYGVRKYSVDDYALTKEGLTGEFTNYIKTYLDEKQ